MFLLLLILTVCTVNQSVGHLFHFDTSQSFVDTIIVNRDYKPNTNAPILLAKTFQTGFSIVCQFDSNVKVQYQGLLKKKSLDEKAIEVTEGVLIQSLSGDRRGQTYFFQTEVFLDVSGMYYCAANINGVIYKSNIIEILDIYFQNTKLSPKVPQNDQILVSEIISNKRVPIYFKCGVPSIHSIPDEYAILVQPQVHWALCSSSYADCKTGIQHLNKLRSDKTYHILPDGTLLLKKTDRMEQKKTKLVCYFGQVIYSIHHGPTIKQSELTANNPLLWDFNEPMAKEIILFTEQTTHLTLHTGNINFILYGSLEPQFAAPTEASFHWTFNNRTLPHGFVTKSGNTKLFLPEIMKFQFAGTYRFEISHFNESKFVDYVIKVVGPPEIKYHDIDKVYSMVTKTVSLHTIYKNAKQIKVLVNGVQLNPESTTPLESVYPAYLNSLKYALTPSYQMNNELLTYSVYLHSNNLIDTWSLSHTVTFVVSNEHGEVRHSTDVIVFPLPQLVLNPTKQNCTVGCYSNANHTFKCDLIPFDQELIKVIVFWERDGVAIHRDPQVSDIMTDFLNGTLLIHPVEANKLMLLENASLRCRIKFVRDLNLNDDFIYDSALESDPNMIATIKLRVYTEPPVMYSYWWFSIIGIFFFVVIVGSIVYAYKKCAHPRITYRTNEPDIRLIPRQS